MTDLLCPCSAWTRFEHRAGSGGWLGVQLVSWLSCAKSSQRLGGPLKVCSTISSVRNDARLPPHEATAPLSLPVNLASASGQWGLHFISFPSALGGTELQTARQSAQLICRKLSFPVVGFFSWQCAKAAPLSVSASTSSAEMSLIKGTPSCRYRIS